MSYPDSWSPDRDAGLPSAAPLARVLGPSADAVGQALRRYTEYQLRNVRRIVESADAKSSSLDEGAIANARVAHVVLADGPYCDDELTAHYLGGLLAGSRSPQGRDDRAVSSPPGQVTRHVRLLAGVRRSYGSSQ